MANDNHLFSAPCYNGTMLKQDYYNDFFEIGQQKINFSFFDEKCNIKCERKRKPPDALFFYPETEKKAIHGHFIKSVLCGVG